MWTRGGTGSLRKKVSSYPLLEGPSNVHRYHQACRASMMMGLPIASSVFLVHGPAMKRQIDKIRIKSSKTAHSTAEGVDNVGSHSPSLGS